MDIIYLDNSATTRMDDEVLKEMLPYMKENYGNASSIYSIGRESRKVIEEARIKVASILNCQEDEIYFTSGGSESDNTAIIGIAYSNKNKGKHIITSKIEHLAVLDTCKKLEKEGFEVTYLDVDEDGIIKLDELKKAIREDTILISIMSVNNEIGTIQPIEEIGKIAKEKGIIFHTDAVQAIGTLPIDVRKMNIDALSLSAHKFYGPKGVGALYIKKSVKFKKYINGGHQEKNMRAGTENVAGIVGLAKAIELAYKTREEHYNYIKNLRDYCLKNILERIPGTYLNGSIKKRVPGNINISFKDIEGSVLVMNLDMEGICVSSGSACTSGSLNPSHVLLAIGANETMAMNSLRITIGKYNTKDEIDIFIEKLTSIVSRLRNINEKRR